MNETDQITNYCLWSGISIFLYTAFEFYINRRQIKALQRNEMPQNIALIKDKWDVKLEDIQKANEYNAEKM